MSSIVIAGDTSGSVTLQAPAVAGSSVLSLPAVTDTVAGIAATQTLTNKSIVATQLTGTIAAARLPAGSVLQVVYGSTTTQVEASYSSATDLGLSASITPTSSASKILVLVSANGLGTRGNATFWDSILVRDSTNINGFCNYMTSSTSGNLTFGAGSLCVLDSPATTSSTTYKLQGIRRGGSDNCIFNITTSNAGARTMSTITLLEIAQ